MIFPLRCRSFPDHTTGIFIVFVARPRDVRVQTPWSWRPRPLSLASKTTVFRPQDRDVSVGGNRRREAQEHELRFMCPDSISVWCDNVLQYNYIQKDIVCGVMFITPWKSARFSISSHVIRIIGSFRACRHWPRCRMCYLECNVFSAIWCVSLRVPDMHAMCLCIPQNWIAYYYNKV